MVVGFDNEKYVKLQSEEILKRVNKFSNKLYMEFGGKLFDDLHASRVLPGFNAGVKIDILKQLKDKLEIIFVVSAKHIEKRKVRADYAITYDAEVLRQVDNLRSVGLTVSSIVITLFTGQARAQEFADKLKARGEKVYFHTPTEGYPNNVETIVSDRGYGANPYIPTTKPLVVVTAPGPGSGKLATCLSQLYHEYKRGVKAGYAKFETFPVWNLPLRHPTNVAYEAATADLGDINMIDNFHLEAYGQVAINYNRDLECFPVVQNILTKITGNAKLYQSPTDMGVNKIGFCIKNDKVVRRASEFEIIRRYQKALVDIASGGGSKDIVKRIEILMSQLKISLETRKIITNVRNVANMQDTTIIGLMLEDERCVYGKSKKLLSASSAVVLNALKVMAGIDDSIDLLPSNILTPLCEMKKNVLKVKNGQLSLKETLIALSLSTAVNPLAKRAIEKIPELYGLEAHSSCILSGEEEQTLKKLGINITCEPLFSTSDLYMV
ncbi:MAG: DUF1846 domain-containing protein [Clostridia bacterium]|nr:DUF1846 domain-containing protein [Clostridia bacterium]